MRSRKLAIASGLLLVVATSVPALAQPASTSSALVPYPAACKAESVSSSVSDSAHGIYQGGKAYYDDAKYDEAIQQFRVAYGKDCSKHELLIIISRAYELKGDKAAAINALEVYLERVPSSPDAQQHRTRIENMKKQLAAVPTATAAPTTTAPPQEMREHTVPPWLVVGLGGAGVVVGIVVLATAPKLPAGCSATTKTCMHLTGAPDPKTGIPVPLETPEQFTDRQDRAGKSQTQPTIGIAIAVIGGVLVAGGLAWHFLEPTGPVEKTATIKKPAVSPEVGPGFAGLSFGGSF